MGKQILRRRRIPRAAVLILLTGVVAACTSEAPAPVVVGGASAEFAGSAPAAAMPPPIARAPDAFREGRHIVVRPGQSIGLLAHEYHVSKRAIIAANHLAPPYKIEIGQRLVIPGGAEPPVHEAAAMPAPPRRHGSPEIIPLDGPPPAAAAPPQSGGRERPQAAAPAPSGPSPEHTAHKPPSEPSAAEEARAEGSAGPALPHAGHLPWPVHGHVLAGYGVAAGGVHNDGINIAAPKGAPVQAVDSGVVAYAGNELRGYGNLVLIKHANGYISAYAHCEELLVKRGDKVARGQVIAKVGETGGVGEPQLHFELRRGKRAVDPREFLTPAPTAGGPEKAHEG